MNLTRSRWVQAALLLALASCASPASPTGGVASPLPTTTPTSSPGLTRVAIAGTVSLPNGLLANNERSLTGARSAGGNGRGYGIAALASQNVAGVQVFLADAAGVMLPNLPPVLTDAQGAYKIADVPAGFTFLVVAKAQTAGGVPVRLKTLAKSDGLGVPANVDAASTLIVADVVRGLPTSDLGELDETSFQTAHDLTAQQLATGDSPDFSNEADVLAKMVQLVAQITALKSSIDVLQQGILRVTQSFATLRQVAASPISSTPPAASFTPVPALPTSSKNST